MAADRLHPLFVAKGKVVAAQIDDGQQRAKDGDRGRKQAAGVEQVKAQGRVQLAVQFDHMIKLRLADVGGKVRVIARPGRKGGHLMHRKGDFVV